MEQPVLLSEQQVRAGRPIVYVTVPAKVAYDIKSMTRVTASILDRLGCPECHSGFDIRWDFVRDFYVNEKLDVLADVGAGRG